MKWITQVDVQRVPGYVNYQDKILTLGSCFADEVGEQFVSSGFDAQVNPAGVIFNPIGLASLIDNSLQSTIDESLILQREQFFHHYGFHSSLKAQTKLGLISKIQKLQTQLKEQLMTGTHLFLTFGSAWVYELGSKKTYVNNCHKMDASLFNKVLLGLDESRECIEATLKRLFRINPMLKITLTVSPVRHTRDGLHENNLSKSVLLLLSQYLCERFDNVRYFPAYEIAIDELRDYRFYKEDLIHPNQQAVNYIYSRLRESYFDDATNTIFELQEKMNKALNHRAMNDSDEAELKHQQHIDALKDKLEALL